jgi:hypothetical protein
MNLGETSVKPGCSQGLGPSPPYFVVFDKHILI